MQQEFYKRYTMLFTILKSLFFLMLYKWFCRTCSINTKGQSSWFQMSLWCNLNNFVKICTFLCMYTIMEVIYAKQYSQIMSQFIQFISCLVFIIISNELILNRIKCTKSQNYLTSLFEKKTSYLKPLFVYRFQEKTFLSIRVIWRFQNTI